MFQSLNGTKEGRGREKGTEVKEGINMCLVMFSHDNCRTYITKDMLLLVYLVSCDVCFFLPRI
jgi:hypothetical protein